MQIKLISKIFNLESQGFSKFIGGMLLVSGTALGAAMLGLPLAFAGIHFAISATILIAVWFIMLLSALLLLEVNQAFTPPNNSFNSMTTVLMGKAGRIFMNFCLMLLKYALICAYFSVAASLLASLSLIFTGGQLSYTYNTLIVSVILIGIVAVSENAIDWSNRSLFLFKIILLALVFIVLLPQISSENILSGSNTAYSFAAIPIVIVAFGFHIVIPSVVQFMGSRSKQLPMLLFMSSFFPLVIYILWQATLQGTLPLYGENGFEQIITHGDSVGGIILALNHLRPSLWLTTILNIFVNLAVITSFLGVSLSLLHFIRDKEQDTHSNLRALSLTFVPPIIVALLYPDGFITLLGYGSIFVALTCAIFPAILMWKLRNQPTLRSSYKAPGGTLSLLIVFLFGIVVIVLELLRQFQMLPVLT
jgi:tyrosine-specific transport protein